MFMLIKRNIATTKSVKRANFMSIRNKTVDKVTPYKPVGTEY
jgi:hypothetical protein